MSNICSICEKQAHSRCADCEERNYCSIECQKYDWNEQEHYKICEPTNKIGILFSPIPGDRERNEGIGVYSQLLISTKKNLFGITNPLNYAKFKKMFLSSKQISPDSHLPYSFIKTGGEFGIRPTTQKKNDYYTIDFPEGKSYDIDSQIISVINRKSDDIFVEG